MKNGNQDTKNSGHGDADEDKNSGNECTPELIDAYLKELKASGKLKIEPDQKKQKIDASRRKIQSHTKAVHVLACDYNEDLELVALALIDREVKIYFVKQSGAKISLKESFSFYVKFPNGGAVACLHVDKFVTNNRPILSLGSLNGDIAVYFLDQLQPVGTTGNPGLRKP